jgi:conjugative element/phage-associated large polyvalent protein
VSGLIDQARDAGYTEDEIREYIAPQIAEAQAQGYGEEEINKYLGVKPVDVQAANTALAKRVHNEVTKAQDGGKAKEALCAMGQTVKDAATVYAPIEAALNVATGVTFGFPMYLGAGLGAVINKATGRSDEDPKEVASRFAELVTYQPHTDAGERFTASATYPLRALIDMAGVAGKKVADTTDSPVAAALTDATIQTLPMILVPALGRALRGKVPTESDMHAAAQDIAPDAPFPQRKMLAQRVQEAYEQTGIDPQTMAEQAKADPIVMQDLASSNRMPLAGGDGNKPPAAPPAPPAPPQGDPAKAVLDRVSVGETVKDSHTLDSLYTAIKDDLYPIAKIEKALNEGQPLGTAESPYQLARLVRGAAGKATQFLDYGTFDWNSYKNTGPGLKQILEPHKNDLDGFRAYAVSRRAVELDGRGIQTGVPLDEARAVVKEGGKYAEAFGKLQTYQNNLVKYLRDSGIISDDNYAAMIEANKDYVPFHRVFEGGQAGVGAGMRTRNPIKSIKGSERIIVDPLESVIKNTYLYTALAERNAVNAAFGKQVFAAPELAADLGVKVVKTKMKPIEVTAEELAAHGIDAEGFTIFRPNALRPADNQIRYYENGKPVTLELPADVAEAFNATDRQTAGMLVKILAYPAKTLRAGSVLAPDFMLRNVVRDQLTAFSFSKNGYIPVWDMMSGALSIAKKDAPFQDWLKSGGANAAMVSMDRAYLQQHLLALDQQTGLMSRSWNVAKSPLEVLRIGSELLENATRLGEFKRAMAGEAGTKADIQSAGFESREVTLDFQRIGAQTRSLNMIAAFMNAGLEGVDRTARAFKDAPIGTTAKVGAGITLPSVLLWAANHDDPRWKEIPNWERDLFWIVMTDEHVYRIPKPFEVGVIFGSVPERMLDKFVADNPNAFKNFGGTLMQAFGANVMPTAAMPPLEQVTNHSFFTGNPLIPSRMENLLPEYQAHEYGTELSKAVGGIIGAFPGLHDKSIASPIVIDNYVRGWTGSLGVYVTQALDAGLRKAGVLPDPPQPLPTLADIPVVKAFVVRYPSATAQSVADFYEKYAERKKVYDTFQYLVKNGDPDAAIKEANLNPAAFSQMEGAHETIGTLNNAIRMVWKNPDMTPSDKRQLIDSMYGQMIEVARAGNEAMVAVDKVLK